MPKDPKLHDTATRHNGTNILLIRIRIQQKGIPRWCLSAMPVF
jgi:hypothetical protein